MSITLLEAVTKNNLEEVNKLLAEPNVNLKVVDKHGQSLLWIATFHNNNSIVEALLKAGADAKPPLIVPFNKTILHWVAEDDRRANIVEAAIKAGANVNAIDGNQDTPLKYAVKNDRILVVEALIKAGADVKKPLVIKRNMTILHWAAMEDKRLNIVEAAIKAGADVNAVENDSKTTPLHWAASRIINPSTNITIALIKAGANVNVIDKNSMTPLHYAIKNGHLAIIEVLLKAKSDINLSIQHTFSNNAGIIKMNCTVLQWVMSTEFILEKTVKTTIIQKLFEFGANIDLPIEMFESEPIARKFLMTRVLFSEYQFSIRELFEIALNPNRTDTSAIFKVLGNGLNGRLEKDGDTALHIALINNNELALKLIEKGIPLNISSKKNPTVLEMLKNQQPNLFRNLCLALHEINEIKNSLANSEKLQADIPLLSKLDVDLNKESRDVKSTMDRPVRQNIPLNTNLASLNPPAAEASAAAAGAGAGAHTPAAVPSKMSKIYNAKYVADHDNSKLHAKLDSKISLILEWLGFNINSLDEEDVDFKAAKGSKSSNTADTYLETTKQSIFYELGKIIIQYAAFFPLKIGTVDSLLARVKSNHYKFKEANALRIYVLDMVTGNDPNQGSEPKRKKIEFLLNAGDASEHQSIIGNVMADMLDHDLFCRDLRNINKFNTDSALAVYALFNTAYTLKKQLSLTKAEMQKQDSIIQNQASLIKKLESLLKQNNIDYPKDSENKNVKAHTQHTTTFYRDAKAELDKATADSKTEVDKIIADLETSALTTANPPATGAATADASNKPHSSNLKPNKATITDGGIR